MAKFEKAMVFVLRWEGGFVDNPADPGGATNKGVTQGVYNAYRKSRGLKPQGVLSITDAEVNDIYKTRYWDAAGCERMTEPVSTIAMDIAVNMGVGRVKQFIDQISKSMDSDPSNDVDEVAHRLLELRTNFYYAIVKRRPASNVFLKGWLNRVRALREYCGLK
jgi:lysozyme family protein